jgi:hypothetical protein
MDGQMDEIFFTQVGNESCSEQNFFGSGHHVPLLRQKGVEHINGERIEHANGTMKQPKGRGSFITRKFSFIMPDKTSNDRDHDDGR